MAFYLDEKRSVEILKQVLKQSGLPFRTVVPGEEGGFFYVENGERKKFTENIFIKRSLKVRVLEQAKMTLGEYFYEKCHDFFRTLFNCHCEFKIIMTRRCFLLFKIFTPILAYEGITNSYGTIITDRAMPLYTDKIAAAMQSSQGDRKAILLADDTMVFGRTVSKTFDQLRSIGALTYNDFAKYVTGRCIVTNSDGLRLSSKYLDIVKPIDLTPLKKLRTYSSGISDLIGKMSVANTCYIISYFEPQVDPNMKDLAVYQADVSAISGIGKFISSATVREYIRDNTVVATPLVIFKPLYSEKIKSMILDLLGLTSDALVFLQGDSEQMLQVEQQYLSLLASHALLRFYLVERGKVYSLDDTDYYDTLNYNFSAPLRDAFVEADNNGRFLESGIFTGLHKCDTINCLDLENAVFRQGIIDNHSGEIRKVVFNNVSDISEFPIEHFSTLFKLIDSGKATIKPQFDPPSGIMKTCLFAGEQAFRIGSLIFEDVLPYYDFAETVSYGLDTEQKRSLYSYLTELLRDALDTPKNLTGRRLEYINMILDNGGDISDISYELDNPPVLNQSLTAKIQAYAKRLLLLNK